MAKCSICGKGVVFGQNVSHSHRRTNRSWKPNIRKVKAIVEDNNGVFHFVSLDQYLRANDGASAQTGQSYDDDNQYEVILSGRSAFPSIIFEKSVAEGVIAEPIVGA